MKARGWAMNSDIRNLLAATLCAAAVSCLVDSEIVDGIRWSYTVSDGKATLEGDNKMRRTTISSSAERAITIPAKLGGCPVVAIGRWAFSSCRLKSVTIPPSVTSIGEGAFASCDLKSVTIQNGVTSIGEGAFSHCSHLKSVTIPPSVTSIGEEAFWRCRHLTSVTIPDAFLERVAEIFDGCDSLELVNGKPL